MGRARAGSRGSTSIDRDDGWRERLRELGRRSLWEGAQPLEVVETG